jgi:hypothetical protein
MDRHTAHERCSSALSEDGVRWSVPLPAAGSGAAAEDEPATCEERLALLAGRRSPLEEAAVAEFASTDEESMDVHEDLATSPPGP